MSMTSASGLKLDKGVTREGNMVNKYCYKCAAVMTGTRTCTNCGAQAIEMPKSTAQLKTIERIQEIQDQNKPKRGTGCLVMIIAGIVMFGIPAGFAYLGPGLITYSISSAALLLVNGLVYKYRKTMHFEKKTRYFNLTKKSRQDFENMERLCLNCNQLVLDDMVYCPKCGRHAAQDIPIDLRLKAGHKSSSAEVN
jgi:RNA polymerase subunit RPABC4/transcription elongation factor Spt4